MLDRPARRGVAIPEGVRFLSELVRGSLGTIVAGRQQIPRSRRIQVREQRRAEATGAAPIPPFTMVCLQGFAHLSFS
jgi:hypothetical protein